MGLVTPLALEACAARGKDAGAQAWRRATQQQADGELAAHYDALLALATAAPDSRVGRRARAVLLSSNGPIDELLAVSAVARELRPAAAGVPPDAQLPATGDEAPSVLRRLQGMQSEFHRQHGRFCRDFVECPLEVPAQAHYFYFLGDHAVVGGNDSERTVESEVLIRRWLVARRLRPHSTRGRYLALAVGLVGEVGLDVWSLDHHGALVHLNER